MSTVTPVFGWTVPEMDDRPAGPDQILELATDIENTVKATGVLSFTPEWWSTGSPKPTLPSSLTCKYTVDRGWCSFVLYLGMSGATTGGAGQWVFTLPKAAHPDLPEQWVRGKLWAPQWGNVRAWGLITRGASVVHCYASQVSSFVSSPLQHRDASNTPGTNNPTPSPGPLQAGGNVVLHGRYLTA